MRFCKCEHAMMPGESSDDDQCDPGPDSDAIMMIIGSSDSGCVNDGYVKKENVLSRVNEN